MTDIINTNKENIFITNTKEVIKRNQLQNSDINNFFFYESNDTSTILLEESSNDELISLSDDSLNDNEENILDNEDIEENINANNNENLLKEIKIEDKTYYVDVSNGGAIYDQHISKVGEYDGKEYKIY